MSTAKIILNKQGRYIPKKYKHDELGAIALFLAYHVKDEGFFLYELLKDPEAIIDIIGDFGSIERWVWNSIRITICFNKDHKDYKAPQFKRKNFKLLIKTWMNVCKKKPKEIILKLDNEKMTINGITALKFS